MRTLFASLALVLITSCAPESDDEKIERLEIRLSGWSSLDIVIDEEGNGAYRDSEPHPDGTSGRFELDEAELTELLARLRPYRDQSVPVSDENALEFIDRTCPEGVPLTFDAGAFYARWLTTKADTHYFADFGCDHERLLERNRELLDIVNGLPIQTSW